jgi:hypothetical protein
MRLRRFFNPGPRVQLGSGSESLIFLLSGFASKLRFSANPKKHSPLIGDTNSFCTKILIIESLVYFLHNVSLLTLYAFRLWN